MKTDPKLEKVYAEARWPLTASDKYVIRVIWNRYLKLYKQQQQGKLNRGEYATRRRNYLNLVYDIMGMYSVPLPELAQDEKFTGYYDDTNKPIFIEDKLKSEWNYEVIVQKDGDSYYGKLVCDENHSCKDIPYALNKGRGYTKID
jgi:hypothetical protein